MLKNSLLNLWTLSRFKWQFTLPCIAPSRRPGSPDCLPQLSPVLGDYFIEKFRLRKIYLKHWLWLWHRIPLEDLHVALVVLHNLLRLHLLAAHGFHHQISRNWGLILDPNGLTKLVTECFYLGWRRDFIRGPMCSMNSSSICLMLPLKFGLVATCRPGREIWLYFIMYFC